jgi:hypothetical protein
MDTRFCLPVVENYCVLDGLLLGVGIAVTTAAAAAPTAATERTAHTTRRTETGLNIVRYTVYTYLYPVGLFLTFKIDAHCTGNGQSGDKKNRTYGEAAPFYIFKTNVRRKIFNTFRVNLRIR